MNIEKVANRTEGGKLGAELFINFCDLSPEAPFGLATGETMDAVYSELANKSWKPASENAFALDEYVGLDKDHKNSYLYELTNIFTNKLGWEGIIHVPGQPPYDGASGTEVFEQALAKYGPLSVQLLGLGVNGHIAFNEPGASFDSRTRVVQLHKETRDANSRFFELGQEVPKEAVTQGLATISQAKNLVLLVFGQNKLAALLEALESPSSETPLAALLGHPSLTLVTDLSV